MDRDRGKAAEGIGGSQSRSGKDERAAVRVRQLAASWFPGLDADLVDRLCADAWLQARSDAPDRPVDAVAALAATSVRRAGLSAMRGEPAVSRTDVDPELASEPARPTPEPAAVAPAPEPVSPEPVASEPTAPEPAPEAPVPKVWTLAAPPEEDEPVPKATAASAPVQASGAPASTVVIPPTGTERRPDRVNHADPSAGRGRSAGGRRAVLAAAGIALFGVVATALGSSDEKERRVAATPPAARPAPALPPVPAGPAPEAQRPTAITETADEPTPAANERPTATKKQSAAAKEKRATKRKRAAAKRKRARNARRNARKGRVAQRPVAPTPRRPVATSPATPATPQRVQPAAPARARPAPVRRAPASGSRTKWGDEFTP